MQTSGKNLVVNTPSQARQEMLTDETFFPTPKDTRASYEEVRGILRKIVASDVWAEFQEHCAHHAAAHRRAELRSNPNVVDQPRPA
jgi:hypothetical protein